MQLLEFKFHKLAFESLPDADLEESVESSAASESLKTRNPRCFNIVGCLTLSVWFYKRQHHCFDLAFFVVDS